MNHNVFRSFSKIYTKTGDKGTSFLNAQTGRLPKYSLVFKVLGDIDELASSLRLVCKSLTVPTCYCI